MKVLPTRFNALPEADFIAQFGGVYEHSAWIAAAAAIQRPFATVESLKSAMEEVVNLAPERAQLALIRAHPDLAGRLARLGRLTPESSREQAAAGLDAMTVDELRQMAAANTAYRDKFGFPFIICARRHSKDSILREIQRRLKHDSASEQAAALREIHHIAQLRIDDILCQEN